MANNNRCGCSRGRNSNNSYGCLNSVGGRWEAYPYYGGPCPDANGCYSLPEEREDGRDRDRDRDCRRRRRRKREDFGMFTASMPVAVAANGVVPLVSCNGLCDCDGFNVNSGLITVQEEGTYLATYTVRVPEGTTVDSTFTLNVNEASQSSAILQMGGAGPTSATAQSIFEVCDYATVTLRTSEPINVTETSPQPLVTLSLVRLA